jgi:hypothetical protein
MVDLELDCTVNCTNIDPDDECDIQEKSTYLRQEPHPYICPSSNIYTSAIHILGPPSFQWQCNPSEKDRLGA